MFNKLKVMILLLILFLTGVSSLAATTTTTPTTTSSSSSSSTSTDDNPTTKVKRKRLSRKAFENNIHVIHAGAFSWVESSHLRRFDTLKYRIRASVYGATLGYQKIIKDEDWFYSYYTLGALIGEALVTNVNPDIDYLHRGALTYGFEYTSGILFHPKSDKVLIGFALPVIARQINYRIPDSSYKFTNKINVLPFLALEMQWHITDDLAFIQKIGAPLLSDGALWMISLDWIL